MVVRPLCPQGYVAVPCGRRGFGLNIGGGRGIGCRKAQNVRTVNGV